MSIQSMINVYPQGTTFCMAAGTYRMTAGLEPKKADVFIGAQGAILNGSKLVSTWSHEGSYWVAYRQTQETTPAGTCEGTYTGCKYNEDLYMDDQSQWQVTTLSELSPGEFYFDYPNDKIYLADDPSGHRVEATVAARALRAWSSDVQFKGFIVEKFSNPGPECAVCGGPGGLVEGNEVRFTHGTGVSVGSSGRIVNNYIHDNGELGLAAPGASTVHVQNNEVALNNTTGFKMSWEAGGGKFVGTTYLTVTGNYVHNNRGPGLWTDTNNVYTVYRDNYIADNLGEGIVHEISYDATIANNVIVRNGNNCGTYCWGAGIFISTSSNVEIYGNALDGNKRGIFLYMQNRGSGTVGRYEIDNDYVHDNTVSMKTGATGLQQTVGDNSYFTSHGNRFQSNTYYLGSYLGGDAQFYWMNSLIKSSTWTSYGEDTLGQFYKL
jgi:parallel beta-helix repeat protein